MFAFSKYELLEIRQSHESSSALTAVGNRHTAFGHIRHVALKNVRTLTEHDTRLDAVTPFSVGGRRQWQSADSLEDFADSV